MQNETSSEELPPPKQPYRTEQERFEHGFHFVVDIETLASDARATVLSIGVVRINLQTPNFKILADLHLLLNVDSQKGRSIDPDTMRFWLRQDLGVVERILIGRPRLSPRAACLKFAKLLEAYDRRDVYLWSKGNDFDIAILSDLHLELGLKEPWSYSNVCDVRTFRRACLRNVSDEQRAEYHRLVKEIESRSMKHCSLDDARVEAFEIWNLNRLVAGA